MERFLWHAAPWYHICGELKRNLKGWDPNSFKTVDDAEQDLDAILSAAILKHVKKVRPSKPKPAPWWNESCQSVYTQKCKLFSRRMDDLSSCVNYNAALSHCRAVHNRAFAQYQTMLAGRFDSMKLADRDFWKLAKEIGV